MCQGQRLVKQKAHRWRYFLWVAVLVITTFASFAASAAGTPVPIQIDGQGNNARIVFDFPKLTAYYVQKTETGVELKFDTPFDLAIPQGGAALIKKTETATVDESMKVLKIFSDQPLNATPKRLKKKIIFTLAAAAPTPPKPTADEKPHDITDKKTPEPAPEKKVASVPESGTKENTPDSAAKVSETPASSEKVTDAAPTAVAAPVETVEKEINAQDTDAKISTPDSGAETTTPDSGAKVSAAPESSNEKTKISISGIEPIKIAVFERFNTLWIVTDTPAAAALEPEITGPLAGILGRAKLLKFQGGAAWRYSLPEGNFVSVEKNNLTWNIIISPTQQEKRESPPQFTVTKDEKNGKTKLMTEIPGVDNILNFEDPAAGDTLYVIPVNQANIRYTQARRFPNVEILSADIGLVVRPLEDDMKVSRFGSYVLISSPQGVIATPGTTATFVSNDDTSAEAKEVSSDISPHDRLFDFPNWRQGGIAELAKNVQRLQNEIAAAVTPEDREARLMKLALVYFANNFGHETIGVLRIIEDENPDIAKNPSFIALKGAANAMAEHYQEALQYLSNPAIQQQKEVALWIGYVAAATEQWHMANRSFPNDTAILSQYPDNIAIPITLYMAESALRLGNVERATKLLDAVNISSEDFSKQSKAAFDYLRGEAYRQSGEMEEAERMWKIAANGLDRLYHSKASLALANLELQEKKIDLKKAIEHVDSLRFAWRGDGLEVQTLQNLGDLKVKDSQYLSGLQDMKTAAELSDELKNDSAPIHQRMTDVLTELFVQGGADKISPLEAVSVYNEFNTLMPPGDQSRTARLKFADYLIRIDLLSNAAPVLEEELQKGLPEEKIAPVGNKLAVVYLLDSKPQQALDALGRTAAGAPDEKTLTERALLKARALSQLGKTEEAIGVLAGLDSKEARQLRVDVLWRGQKWADAANAIEALVPNVSDKISEEDAKLVIDMAVAAKLSGNPQRLQEIKARYGDAMAATTLASTFGVVTRDGGSSELADAQSLLKLSGEVDMFKGFLDQYKSTATP